MLSCAIWPTLARVITLAVALAGVTLLVAGLPKTGNGQVKDQPPLPVEEARYDGKTTSYWITRLSWDDVKVRREAIRALATIGPEAEKAVPALIEALEDEVSDVRNAALRALGEIGPKAKGAASAIAHAIRDKNEHFAYYAIIAARKIKPDDDKVLEALMARLEKPGQDGLAHLALNAMRAIGPKALDS